MPEIPDHLSSALAGRYEPKREIGRGGMATVYLARDIRHNRDVAVKVLKPDLRASIGIDRFLREIEIAAQLNHPHILPLLDSGDTDGVLHYVMPYIDGESLRGLLNRKKRLELSQAQRLVRETADALGYAHRQGVVHRDIKPENVLLSDGHAVVADFGIAKAIFSAGAGNLTRTGFPVGTPGYMSPEQAAARTDLDERTDVFSLACLCYEMLVGDVPAMWVTEDDARMLRFMDAPPHQRELLDRLSGSIEQVLVIAMAMRPQHRFATPGRFAEALEEATKGKLHYPEAHARHIIENAALIQAQRHSEEANYSLGGIQRLGAEVAISPQDVRDAVRALESAKVEPETGGLFGARAKIEFQRMFDGEIPEADFEEVLEEIRLAMGEVGRINPTLGKSLSWNSLSYQNSIEGAGRLTHVMVTPRDGATRIRVTESAGQHSLVFISLLVAAGVLSGAASGALIEGGLLEVVPAAVAAIMGSSYFTMRMLFKRLIKKRYRMLSNLLEKLAGYATRSIGHPQLEEMHERGEKTTPAT
jgi:serine/threonine protein kinase